MILSFDSATCITTSFFDFQVKSGMIDQCSVYVVLFVIVTLNIVLTSSVYYGEKELKYFLGKHKYPGFTSSPCSVNTLSWVIKFVPGLNLSTTFNELFDDHGLVNVGQVGHLRLHYEFHHLSWKSYKTVFTTSSLKFCQHKFNTDTLYFLQTNVSKHLNAHKNIEWFIAQQARIRTSRNIEIKDPQYSKQWHLVSLRFENSNGYFLLQRNELESLHNDLT